MHRLGGHARDTAIVSAIIAMAHALGLSVVAEGVESSAQRAQLMELGCGYGQGFLFSRPPEAEAVLQRLRAEHKDEEPELIAESA